MASKQARRAPGAGFRPPRDLSPEGKAFTATHPALYLHVYCNFSGVQVVAYVDYLDPSQRLRRTEVAKACFRPPEVSERLVVEWGARALAHWLGSVLVPPEEGR